MYLKYANGKFIEDENYIKHGTQAVTVYTGSVILLKDVVFDKTNKKWIGTNNKGIEMVLKPSAIIEMVKVG